VVELHDNFDQSSQWRFLYGGEGLDEKDVSGNVPVRRHLLLRHQLDGEFKDQLLLLYEKLEGLHDLIEHLVDVAVPTDALNIGRVHVELHFQPVISSRDLGTQLAGIAL